MMRFARSSSSPAGSAVRSGDLFHDEDQVPRTINRLPSSSISSQDSFLSIDDDMSACSSSSASDDASGDDEEELLDHVPSFIKSAAAKAGDETVNNNDEDDEAKTNETKEGKNMTPEEKSEALRYLVS